jgi:hypothetical protein
MERNNETAIYEPNEGEKYEKLKKLYNEFREEYFFDIEGSNNKLIITERDNKDGIKIYPRDKGVEISGVLSNKFYSELEMRLVKSIIYNYKRGLLFATKDGKFIEIGLTKEE